MGNEREARVAAIAKGGCLKCGGLSLVANPSQPPGVFQVLCVVCGFRWNLHEDSENVREAS